MVRSLQVCRDHLEQSTLLCPTSLCSRTVSFKTNSRQTQVHFERKPPKKANSHLDLCTSLSLSVPCLGQQKQPVRIWPSLVFPLYPIPEPPQRKKLTRKGNITKKKKKSSSLWKEKREIFQSLCSEKICLGLGSARESLLPALPVSPSFLCLSPKLLVGEAEQSQQMMLPRAWAACQGALPGAGACCLNCLIYCIKQRSISASWAPALSWSVSLSRAHSLPPQLCQAHAGIHGPVS